MGILDDLSMGLGLKDRDDDYYERTARTLGRTQGEAREAQYRRSRGFGQLGRQGLLSGSGMGGYRDTRDMFDGGGPMARGGRYEGGGLISFLANLANAVAGRDMGERVGYGAPTETTMKPKPRIPTNETSINDLPDMSMQPIEGVTVPYTNPYAVGGGFEATAPSAFPVADVASPLNTAKTTAAQDELLSMAQNLVASENPTYNSTMPREERMARVQQKYNELAISLGM